MSLSLFQSLGYGFALQIGLCLIVLLLLLSVVAGVPHPLAATVAVAIKMSAHASLPACNYSVLRTVVATEFICTQT